MKFSKFTNVAEETKTQALDDTRAHIKPYDAKSSVALHGSGFQVTSQSSGSPLGQTNLPQQP
jgi:hypothetical protein